MRTLSCSHWVLVSKLSDHECSLSSLRVVNLRGKVCNDYRECLRQSESFAVLSNVRSSRVLWVWMFLTVHYPLYSSDLRLGWQNRILMTARAQCHQTDNTHYNQAIPGHPALLYHVVLKTRQQFYKTHSSHSVPPLDNIIRDMIQEIWMSSYGIRDHQTGISIVSANIGPLAELQIIKSTIEWNLWGHFRDTKQTWAHGVFPMAWLIPPTLSILRPLPDPESSPFSLAFNFLWPRQKWWV